MQFTPIKTKNEISTHLNKVRNLICKWRPVQTNISYNIQTANMVIPCSLHNMATTDSKIVNGKQISLM